MYGDGEKRTENAKVTEMVSEVEGGGSNFVRPAKQMAPCARGRLFSPLVFFFAVTRAATGAARAQINVYTYTRIGWTRATFFNVYETINYIHFVLSRIAREGDEWEFVVARKLFAVKRS